MNARLTTLIAIWASLGASAMAAPPRFSEIAGPAANSTKSNSKDTAAKSDDAVPASTVEATAKTVESDTPVTSPKSSETANSKAKHHIPVEKDHKTEAALTPTQQFARPIPAILNQAALVPMGAGYQGVWQAESTKVLCRLWQNIPNYGHVAFREGVGSPLEFVLHVDSPPAGAGMARIQTQPPLWSHYVRQSDLGFVELEDEETAISASTEWAQRLLSELSQGMQPVISYYDQADASSDIKITVSNLNFTTSLAGFDSCRSKLLRYNFNQARIKVINFNPDSSRFGAQAQRQLTEVLEILEVDPGIKTINIEIYSPAKELVQYNFRLATRRAQAIRDYLIAKGVNEDKLTITIYTQSQAKLKKLNIKPDQVQVVLNRDKKKKG